MSRGEQVAAQDRGLLVPRRPRGCVDGRYGVREHLLYEDGGIVRCAHCEGERKRHGRHGWPRREFTLAASPDWTAVTPSPEKRSHKRLDPDIKALRVIDRALSELPDDAARKRVMEWVLARGLSKTWITLARFRWITGERDAA